MQALGCHGQDPSSRQRKESHLQKEKTSPPNPDRNGDREGREMGTSVQGCQQTPLCFKPF